MKQKVWYPVRQRLAVLGLFGRQTVWKLLICLLVLLAALLLRFQLLYHRETLDSSPVLTQVRMLCATAFLGWTAILMRSGMNFSTRSDYTLRRLAASERGVLLWQAIYNTLAYVVLTCVASRIMLAQVQRWMALLREDAYASFICRFYEFELYAGTLPGGDWACMARDLIFSLSMGAATACAPLLQRRGKRPVAGTALAILLAYCYVWPANKDMVWICVLAIVLGTGAVAHAWRCAEVEYETA